MSNVSPKNRYYLLSILTVIALLTADYLGLFEGINNHSYDLLFRLRGPRHPSDKIIIAAIDDHTLEKLGRWPISRLHYIEALDKLHRARAIGIDIFFPDFTPQDDQLEKALQSHQQVILSTYINKKQEAITPSFDFPSHRLGHVHLEMGIDGVFRSVFHTILAGETTVHSFSTLLHRLVRSEPLHSGPELDTLQPSSLPALHQFDLMGINYYGNAGSFQQIPFVELLDENKWPASFFADKIILIGLTATGQRDYALTPFTENGQSIPGIEIQATILNNLFDQSSIRFLPENKIVALQFFTSLVLILLIGTTLSRRPAVLYPLLFSVLVYLCAHFFLFYRTWIPPAYLIVFLCANSVCTYIYNLETVKRSLAQANRDWHDSFNSMQEAVIIHNFNTETLLSNRVGKHLNGQITRSALMERTRQLAGGLKRIDDIILSDPALNKNLEISSFVRLDADGSGSGVMHVIRDITRIQQMQEKEALLQAQLIKAQKMESIGRLAGGVAHDFNNVLSAVIGFSEMIRMLSSDKPDINDFAKSIAKAGARGAALARQLLVFSRRQTTEKSVIEPLVLVENMIKMLQRMIPQNIIISVDTTDPVTGCLFADPGQIEQILMNLVVNAGDAMPDGGNIIISVKDQEVLLERPTQSGPIPPGHYVEISVLDTGTGIPPEQLDTIFEPFFSTKSEDKGTGLGLATVYGIVQQHNGFIEVQSRLGLGSNFCILIPRCTQKKAQRIDEPITILEKGTESILVVEEEELFRKVLADILLQLGYGVFSARDDAEAICYCNTEKHHFDLLITGLVKPGMSGRHLAEKLRDDNSQLQVLYISDCPEEIITSYGEWSRQKEHFIQKPVTPSNLSKKIRKIFAAADAASSDQPIIQVSTT